MSSANSVAPTPATEHIPSFGPEAITVLRSLRNAVAAILAGIGDFGKPADIHKTLHVDRTLARQLFRLASTAEPIGNGGMIPSRSSLDRFLRAAEGRGANPASIQSVNDSFRAFEDLVETHAGDRATFNSMVSAASGVDEDWLLADLQHRRNAFRAMSHALGVQVKTRLVTFIVPGPQNAVFCDVATLGAFIGLRVLRPMPHLHIAGTSVENVKEDYPNYSEPLQLNEEGGGYILKQFSSEPLPALLVRDNTIDHRTVYREILLENPIVGNVGASTIVLGTVWRHAPCGIRDQLAFHISENLPSETLLFDVLTAPGLREGALPTGRAAMGFRNRFGAATTKLQGDFTVQRLGQGTRGLATLEVPRYLDILDATASKLQWNLDQFDAWRIRVEFPIYQSTISIEWPK